MSNKKFSVSPGGRVRVELPAKDSADIATPDNGPRRSLTPADDEPARYVFRARPAAVAFYDLGTRLRSVAAGTDPTPPRLRELESSDPADPCADCFSEYASLRTGERGESPDEEGNYTLYSAEDFAALERGLLGPRHPDAPESAGASLDPVDPFGFRLVNGSSREVTTCAQEASIASYIGAGSIYALRVYRGAAVLEVRPAEELAAERWKVRDPAPSDADERWNPKDVESGAAQGQIEITKEARIRAEGHLAVIAEGGASSAFYEFDTGDASCKVTAEPRFDAPAVAYTFRGADNRIYLRPRYPQPPLPTTIQFPVYRVDEEEVVVALPAGSLLAVIGQGSRVYYVWSAGERY